MKELSIEEKAKRYDEAIKVAQRFYNNSVAVTKKGLEDIFPELKESDDEKIRKGIIRNLEYLMDRAEGFVKDELKERIAWLEKIGERGTNGNDREIPNSEQKPADKIEPKFKVGQTIKKEGFNLGFTIVKIEDGFYYNDVGDNFPFTDQDNWELVEQKQDINIQINPSEYINDMGGNGCYLKNTVQTSTWSEEDEKAISLVLKHLYMLHENAKGCSPGWLFDLANDIQFIKSLKDKVQLQPKQEWSEKDKHILNNIYDFVAENLLDKNRGVCADECLKWLKSLKPQSQWKPSDEQMKALKEACDEHWEPDGFDPLYTLYQDLKKLREK